MVSFAVRFGLFAVLLSIVSGCETWSEHRGVVANGVDGQLNFYLHPTLDPFEVGEVYVIEVTRMSAQEVDCRSTPLSFKTSQQCDHSDPDAITVNEVSCDDPACAIEVRTEETKVVVRISAPAALETNLRASVTSRRDGNVYSDRMEIAFEEPAKTPRP